MSSAVVSRSLICSCRSRRVVVDGTSSNPSRMSAHGDSLSHSRSWRGGDVLSGPLLAGEDVAWGSKRASRVRDSTRTLARHLSAVCSLYTQSATEAGRRSPSCVVAGRPIRIDVDLDAKAQVIWDTGRMSVTGDGGYRPMTLAELGEAIGTEVAAHRSGAESVWLQVKEFREEAQHEDAQTRASLLEAEPAPTGDEHWDVFLAALAEHVAMEEDRPAPAWSQHRFLRRFWFPFDTPFARAEAIVHSPPAFRRRNVFLHPAELAVV